jgi:3-oxoacyl-[acyl-carrier protein] reductase
LGRACARRLRDEHHEVITADVADGAEVRLDVTDDAAVAEIVGQIGPIDILLNSAGVIGPGKPLWETTRAEWDATFAVNVHGTAALCRAVVPGMVSRGWGRIVNFASIAGKDGNPNLSAYSATKAAVIGLTKSLGKELATTGVLVNAIAPAVINTEMNAATAPDVLAHITSLIPMKRVGQPEEVAELVAWLVSDRCTFSTGAVFDISGGRATY